MRKENSSVSCKFKENIRCPCGGGGGGVFYVRDTNTLFA